MGNRFRISESLDEIACQLLFTTLFEPREFGADEKAVHTDNPDLGYHLGMTIVVQEKLDIDQVVELDVLGIEYPEADAAEGERSDDDAEIGGS
jgi:hypothetical protein